MDLLKVLLDAQNGGELKQLAREFGLEESAAKNVIGQLIPALGQGIQRNAAGSGGIDSLAKALSSGNHDRYLKGASHLTDQATVDDGNSILGHIFGSKDVSRNVAAHASAETGVDSGIIKKMLPVIAALTMGALSKQTRGGAELSSPSSGSPLDILGGLLGGGSGAGSNSSGIDLGDVLNMARKLF